jgi:hypothetical protein
MSIGPVSGWLFGAGRVPVLAVWVAVEVLGMNMGRLRYCMLNG